MLILGSEFIILTNRVIPNEISYSINAHFVIPKTRSLSYCKCLVYLNIEKGKDFPLQARFGPEGG